MDIAFDCYLEKIVRANRIDGSTAAQPFRFICASCGQSVKVAAIESDDQKTHFRHLHGNNDVECEKYLGKALKKYDFRNLSDRVKRFYRKHIDFYFLKSSRRLFLGIKFSKDEIEEYQESNAFLTICPSGHECKKINKTNFAAGYTERIGLDRYSEEYAIGIDKERMTWHYSIFNKDCPSFFKKSESDAEEIAKFVKGDTIYTNNTYFILKPSGNKPEIELKKIPSVEILDSYTFKIDQSGETIYVVEVRFNEISDNLKKIMQIWKKKIEKPEKLDLLWPPSVEIDDHWYSNSKRVFLHSTFTLEGNKSVNINQNSIKSLLDNLYSINNNDELKVMNKNVDFTLDHHEYSHDNNILEHKTVYAKKIKVPIDNQYFLFSNDGVKKLQTEQIVYLTPNSHICEYYNNYKIKTILFEYNKPLSGEELLKDILANNQQRIPFDFSIEGKLPEYMKGYLNYCEQSGQINAIVARYIKEGRF